MNRSNHQQLSCYFGCIAREKCEFYLSGRRPGTYLIRESRSIPGDFVLSVSENNKVSHYIINNKGNHYQIGDNTFKDLPGIIDFYKDHFLDSTNLIEPLFKVQAQYPFTATDAEDLSFKKNDILVVVEQNEEKWWTAMDDKGNKGLIPEPYVKRLVDIQQAQLAQQGQQGGSPQAPSQNSSLESRKSMPAPTPISAQDGINTRRTSVPPNMRPHVAASSDMYVAIRKHVLPYDETKLSFERGDIIKVLKKNDNGNWFGQNGERTGYFQFTYVQAITSENDQPC
ncbi:PREDICTED: crk-like protein [Acropora digitifera]|uniref:crk-like protein n=1 Tax=Acropora digitifera TaxID=70779 RepID=UPI00077A3B13|nr:PREDICTED: crk-like protein [Acropora digitifera]